MRSDETKFECSIGRKREREREGDEGMEGARIRRIVSEKGKYTVTKHINYILKSFPHGLNSTGNCY